jgi:hypothetical protein
MTVSIWSLLAALVLMYGIVSLLEWKERRDLEKWRRDIDANPFIPKPNDHKE